MMNIVPLYTKSKLYAFLEVRYIIQIDDNNQELNLL